MSKEIIVEVISKSEYGSYFCKVISGLDKSHIFVKQAILGELPEMYTYSPELIHGKQIKIENLKPMIFLGTGVSLVNPEIKEAS